jgi:uncharacterized membrane protein YhiD involved in acid resistance
VSAIGMAIGSGYRSIAVLTTALILAVQFGLGLLESRVFGRCITHDCQIAFDDDGGRTRREIEKAVRALGQVPEAFSVKTAGDHLVMTVPYCDSHPHHRKFLSDLWKIEGVREVRPLR